MKLTAKEVRKKAKAKRMPACKNARLGFYSIFRRVSVWHVQISVRRNKKKGQWREKKRPTTTINNSPSSRIVGVRQKKTRKEKYTNENKSLPSASIPMREREKARRP